MLTSRSTIPLTASTGSLSSVVIGAIDPCVGKPLGSRELEQAARVGRVARADDLWSGALAALK